MRRRIAAGVLAAVGLVLVAPRVIPGLGIVDSSASEAQLVNDLVEEGLDLGVPRIDAFSNTTPIDITSDSDPTYGGALGDINGDGNADLVVANLNAANRLYLGDGAGGFAAGTDVTADARASDVGGAWRHRR